MLRADYDQLDWLCDELSVLEAKGLRRWRCERQTAQLAQVVLNGQELINFGSNDYLGLAADPRLAAAVARTVHVEGCGSGASPLLGGAGPAQQRLEQRLAEFEGTEAALLFPSGFAANAGTLPAIVGEGDAIFSDQKNHASIIDGCRLSRAETHIYPHGDWRHLQGMLEDSGRYRRRLIVTDSLFSMDGDLAPLSELVDLAEKYESMLMVDEAHATGVFGKQGRGVAEHLGVDERIGIRVGTLSKALGSAGGFVCGRRTLIDGLYNSARSYFYSTAPPTAVSASALAALDIIDNEPDRRHELLEQAARLRDALRKKGWNVGPSASQIIPLIVGNSDRAMEYSEALRQGGFFVPGIRPPSVAPGQSLLRLSIRYDHSPEMMDGLVQTLGKLTK